MKTIAILGMGNRGHIYAYHFTKAGAKIVAVCDLNESVLENVQKKYNVDKSMCFTSDKEFFSKGKIADGLIIATQDRDHYEHALAAIDLKYDILLEKPVSPFYEECKDIYEKAKEKGVLIMVSHVLRYSAYYDRIKKIIDSGEIGDVVSMMQIENVGYWHYSHSYVRGNWRNEEKSGPSILTKTCHDLDMIYYLTGKKALTVSSIGTRKAFVSENKPEGAPKYCLDGCPIAKECPYHVNKVYLYPTLHSLPMMILNKRLITQKPKASMKDFREALKTSPYGRCVYQCDNDVMENQMTELKLEDGVNATLHMAAHSNMCYRHIRISGTKGEIIGNDISGKFSVKIFAGRKYKVRFGALAAASHVGGDKGIAQDFLTLIETRKPTSRLSLIGETLESHVNAFAAEISRKTGKVVDIRKDYYGE